MAEGTNLDLELSTDYLSIDDQKILNEKEAAEKIGINFSEVGAALLQPIDFAVNAVQSKNKEK